MCNLKINLKICLTTFKQGFKSNYHHNKYKYNQMKSYKKTVIINFSISMATNFLMKIHKNKSIDSNKNLHNFKKIIVR